MQKYDPIEVEKRILKFWEKNKIYNKQKNLAGLKAKNFYFIQGPPYTTGTFHIAHAWNNALKDIVLRYKRLTGYNVFDRAGWDMHGLPVENGTAKELGLKNKEDIIKYGQDKFIKKCREFALRNLGLMEEDMRRIAVWMDMPNAYKTLSNDYIETVWWFIKEADKQNRIYQGRKSMTWCSTCGTGLAKHELEYENVEEDSIFLKFKIAEKNNQYLIIWTTTPWTIPFNLGVMVNPEVQYDYVKTGEETWIIAKPLVNIFMGMLGKKYKIIKTVKGEELRGIEYEHPLEKKLSILRDIRKKHKWAFRVVLSKDYVDTNAGTGLVHMAPGCGPEDYEVGLKYNLPPFNELDYYGKFSDKMDKFAGWIAKTHDHKFIDEFKKNGYLITTSKVKHEYPHCWRCHNPVVFRATKQWFLKTEDLKEKLRQLNKKIYWVPDWSGSRAMDSWLKNLKDNSITRQRFWGTPAPIWICDFCKDYTVIGSFAELNKLTDKMPKDMHRPWIDKVNFKCTKCKKGIKKRISDIIDVWIDSGVASFADVYYPQRSDLFKKIWPADFILEATEQVRLWFSMLLIISTVAMRKAPYKSAYVHGMINDKKGRKMSKSLGNYISPYEIIDEWGSDTLRYYMIGAAKPGQEIKYNFDDMKIKYRNLEVLWNTVIYILNYSKFSKVNPTKVKPAKLGLEEKYMLSRLNSTIKKVTEKYEKYFLNEVPLLIENLWLDLSRWYIKAVRDRSHEPEVLYVIYKTVLACLKMLSPVAPFITDALYQKLKKEFNLKEESIHLFMWPKSDKKLIDTKLENEVSIIKDSISAILSGREKLNRGIRWPIRSVLIVAKGSTARVIKKYTELIKSMTNILDLNVSLKAPDAIEYEVKVDYAKIGPKYGEDSPRIVGEIVKMSGDFIINELNKNKYIIIKLRKNKKAKLTLSDFIINKKIPDQLIHAEGKGYEAFIEKYENAQMIASGFAREITRKVQALRKDAGLIKTDKINLEIIVPPDLIKRLEQYLGEIKDKVSANKIDFVSRISTYYKDEFTIKGKKIYIGFLKL